LDTFYELFYFDEFEVATDESASDVSLTFNRPELVKTYQEMSENFWAFLRKNSASFFPNDPDWEKRLVLLNGLQNLAIVMFHLIRHQKEDRAIGFLLMGMQKLTSTLHP